MWTETRSREEGRTRARGRPALHEGTPWKEGPRQEKVFQERKTSQHASHFKRVVVRKVTACDCWHPLECSFHQTGNCKLGSKCAFDYTEKAGSEPKRRKNSVVAAKSLDCTYAEGNSAKIHGEGRPSARVSSYSNGINFTEHWEEYCQ